MSGEARNLKDAANEHLEMHGYMSYERDPLNENLKICFIPKEAGVLNRPVMYARRVPNSVMQNKGKRPKLTDFNAPDMEVSFSELEIMKIPGDDEILELVGHNCWVCKKDLMDRTFGDTHSTTPPSTIILACGHTFYTSCFMNNIPEGQEEDPPYIPCSIR